MKKRNILIILMIFALIFTACQKEEDGANIENENETKIESKAEEENANEVKEAEEPEVKENSEEITIKLSLPNAPMALPIAVIEEKGLLENAKFDIANWNMTEELVSMVQSGEYDGFAFPLTAGANLYNKGMDIKLLNIDLWGISYFVTTDENFKSWEDLKGKTVYMPAEGSPPSVMAKHFMNKAGLDLEKDVEFVHLPVPEIAQLMIGGEAEYAVLNEPQVTAVCMKNQNAKVALSFEEEYKRINENDYIIPTAGFGMTGEFIKNNEDFVKEFQKAFEEAVNWINENPEEAGKIAESKLNLKAPLITKAIPRMGFKFVAAENAKEDLNQYYNLIMELNPKIIGGKIPDEGMLYK